MTRKITIAGLALILFGGVVSPSVVHADSTGATDNATAAMAKVSDANATNSITTTTGLAKGNQTNVKITGIELPYTSIKDATGVTHRVYQYSKIDSTVTLKQLQDTNYTNWLHSQYPDDGFIDALITKGPETFDHLSTNVDLNQSRLDYVFSFDVSGMTRDAYVNAMGAGAAIAAWTLSMGTKVENHQITQSEVKENFESVLEPMLRKLQIPVYSTLADGYQSMVDEQGTGTNGETQFETDIIQAKNNTVSGRYLSGYPADKFATLDAMTSRADTMALYQKPMSYFYPKQSDGTYHIDGSLLTEVPIVLAESSDENTETPTPSTSQPVTVHYVDDQGNTLKPDKTLTGKLGDSYKTEPLDIDGYGLTNTTGDETGTFSSTAKSVTYTYAPVITNGGDGDTIAPEGTVIYATKKIGLYKHATFTNKTRKQWYAKKARINRPMFVVTGYAKSKNGVKRYQVKDVNHHSKTNGKTGYVTANAKYTSRVYYATKHKTITVINPKGVNAYSKKALTNKKAHYKQGQVLKVKKIVNQNLTTRFVLSNGRYITANKMLVQSGKQTMPKRVQAKTALNRYSTANLTKQNKHVSAYAVLKVTGWTYSNANNFSKSDTLRYQVAGGYITGNKQLVRVFK